jgi:hypothetical protein
MPSEQHEEAPLATHDDAAPLNSAPATTAELCNHFDRLTIVLMGDERAQRVAISCLLAGVGNRDDDLRLVGHSPRFPRHCPIESSVDVAGNLGMHEHHREMTTYLPTLHSGLSCSGVAAERMRRAGPYAPRLR